MGLETEKQHYLREFQEVESDLSATLWGNVKQPDAYIALGYPPELNIPLKIKKSSPSDIESVTSVVSTPYSKLARTDVIDFLERPKDIPRLPAYIQKKLEETSLKSGQTLSYYGEDNRSRGMTTISGSKSLRSSQHSNSLSRKTKTLGSMFLDSYVKSMNGGSPGVSTASYPSGKLSPLSRTFIVPTEDEIVSIQKKNAHLQLPKSAFKGYTPTGSPGYRHRREAGTGQRGVTGEDGDGQRSVSGQSMSTLGMGSITKSVNGSSSSQYGVDVPFMPWTALDPVFYNERARTALYRDVSTGKVRTVESRSQMSGRNIALAGSLLTTKHPGLDLQTLAK